MNSGNNVVGTFDYVNTFPPEERTGFKELPPHLQGAARKVLNGRRAAKIARNAPRTTDAGKLAQWAKDVRLSEAKKLAKKRNKRKAEKRQAKRR